MSAPDVHPLDCRCEQCLDEAFGPLNALPPDAKEQRDAALNDLLTVRPEKPHRFDVRGPR